MGKLIKKIDDWLFGSTEQQQKCEHHFVFIANKWSNFYFKLVCDKCGQKAPDNFM